MGSDVVDGTCDVFIRQPIYDLGYSSFRCLVKTGSGTSMAYLSCHFGWMEYRERIVYANASLINRLKLRVGYGETSNQAVAPYSTLGRLSSRPYNFGRWICSTGYYVSQLPNPGLGWEYSKTWNFGVDFSLLNNRLSGTIEYYITNTT